MVDSTVAMVPILPKHNGFPLKIMAVNRSNRSRTDKEGIW